MSSSHQRTPTTAENFFEEGVEWAHGGPRELEGESLKRYHKGCTDSGGIFLCRSTPDQIRYAAAYAQSKEGLYRVAVNITSDEVFNLMNQEHIDRVAEIETDDAIGDDFLQTAFSTARDGAVDWSAVDEGVLREAGFKAIILSERPAGMVGDEPIYSLAVFDAKDVAVLGRHSPETMIQISSAAMRYAQERDLSDERALRSAVTEPGEGRGMATALSHGIDYLD